MLWRKLSPAKDGPGQIEELFAATSPMTWKSYTEDSRRLAEALKSDRSSSAKALDLQVRLFCQQGFYLYAEACRRKTIGADGSNPGCPKALEAPGPARCPLRELYRTIFLSACLVAVMLFCPQTAALNKNVCGLRAAASSCLTRARDYISHRAKIAGPGSIPDKSGMELATFPNNH